MRVLILLTMVLFSFGGFAQTSSDQTIFKDVESGGTAKIVFKVSQYDANTIGEFKDELLQHKDKVLVAHYHEASADFTIVYNEHMAIDAFKKVFDKHNISYTINPIIQSSN